MFVGRAGPAILPLINRSSVRFACTVHFQIQATVDVDNPVGAIAYRHEVPVFIVCSGDVRIRVHGTSISEASRIHLQVQTIPCIGDFVNALPRCSTSRNYVNVLGRSGGGKGLGAWGLLLLEGFGEALQLKVVVLQLGESLVLLVQADEINVGSAHNGAAPLLNAYIVVPVIEGVQVWPFRESKLETHLRIAHEVAILFAVVTDRDCATLEARRARLLL